MVLVYSGDNMNIIRKIEKFCGEPLSLNNIKDIINDIFPFLSSEEIRMFIYNMYPEENTICYTDKISFIGNEIEIDAKCLDKDETETIVTTIAMDYYTYMIVMTEKMLPHIEKTEVYKDIDKIGKELSEIEEIKDKPIRIDLFLSLSSAELGVRINDQEIEKILKDWYVDWLGTRRYTPVLLFKLLTNVLRKHKLIIIDNIIEKSYSSLVNLLY